MRKTQIIPLDFFQEDFELAVWRVKVEILGLELVCFGPFKYLDKGSVEHCGELGTPLKGIFIFDGNQVTLSEAKKPGISILSRFDEYPDRVRVTGWSSGLISAEDAICLLISGDLDVAVMLSFVEDFDVSLDQKLVDVVGSLRFSIL